MSYEVMLLDKYLVQDSVKRRDLIGRLRKLGDVPFDEITDSELASYLWSGANVFNPDIVNWDEILKLHEHGILLWAAMLIADFRMMASAKYFPIESRVGKTDPSKRVGSNVSIKQELRKQFDAYLNDANIVLGDDGIIVSDLIRRNQVTDMMEPLDTQPNPPKTSLKTIGKTSTSIDLEWVRSLISDFAAYVVYYDTESNLEDKTRLGIDSISADFPSKEPKCGVREDVTEALVVDKQWQFAARIAELSPATRYFFVVAVLDMNGRVSISNEISVTTEA